MFFFFCIVSFRFISFHFFTLPICVLFVTLYVVFFGCFIFLFELFVQKVEEKIEWKEERERKPASNSHLIRHKRVFIFVVVAFSLLYLLNILHVIFGSILFSLSVRPKFPNFFIFSLFFLHSNNMLNFLNVFNFRHHNNRGEKPNNK